MARESYFTDVELLESINSINGLHIINNAAQYIEVVDKRGLVEKVIRFNKSTFNPVDCDIEYFTDDVYPINIEECLDSLPDVALLILQKIVVISDDWLDIIIDKYSHLLMNEDFVARFDSLTGTLIINISNIENTIDSTTMNQELVEFDYEDEIRKLTWIVVTRELFEALVYNPLFEKELQENPYLIQSMISEYLSIV